MKAKKTTGPRNKILLVDDDPALLETYRELLTRLPSEPEIHTINSGGRALARLEAEPFRLFICDLKMPKMDGLQVLTVVRRKFPQMRTVALTALNDEQFRSRVYSLGVDLFWHKPGNEQEIKVFLECLESLLGPEGETPGFRGVQSKSLIDIIQFECLSQSSSVLKIINGSQTGRIWIHEGEVIDAEADDLQGEEAFRKLFTWRAGAFEILPADPARPRTIAQSYGGLLLEAAQALDEKRGREGADAEAEPRIVPHLAGIPELEFALVLDPDQPKPVVLRGTEDTERVSAWIKTVLADFRQAGDRLQAGPLISVEGRGTHRNVTLTQAGKVDMCLGWKPSLTVTRMRELTRKVSSLWNF